MSRFDFDLFSYQVLLFMVCPNHLEIIKSINQLIEKLYPFGNDNFI